MKMKTTLRFFITGIVLSCFSLAATAQEPSPKTENRQTRQNDWLNAPWTANDRPFHLVRSDVARSFKAKSQKQQEATLKRWQETARKKPTDKMASFRWACGYFAYSSKTGQRDRQLLGEILHSLDRAALPVGYETARMRYLISARSFASPVLLPLGQRLLKRNPKDYDVAYFLIDMFNVRDPLQRTQATKVASQLVDIAPLRPGAHASAGWVHYRIWLNTHKAADAKSSIASYRRYLELAPADDAFRPTAQKMIAQMEN